MGSINKQISRYETTAVYTHPDAKVDIVLVHGLNGDPEKTWSAKNGVFWPSDLLPTSLRDARANILVYGYNADVYSKKHGSNPSDNFIYMHAQTLVTSLTHYRKDELSSHNPIIWVCHSLGGILVKRALLYSNDLRASQHEDYRSIYVSTYGLIFLGTPHTGSEIAGWGTMLQGMSDAVVPRTFFQSESVLLKTLKRDNETLQNINNHFLDIYQRFKILMAHENHKTDMKGTRMLIVDAQSAGPQLPGVTYYAIEATHSGMCKFESRNAPGYRTIATAIREWVVDAPDVIATRWRVEDDEKLARAKHEIEERMKPWLDSQRIQQTGQGSIPQHNDTTLSSPQDTSRIDHQSRPLLTGPETPNQPSEEDYFPSQQSKSDHDPSQEPLFVKPTVFRPNTYFKGRDKELKLLHKMLMDRKRRSVGTSSVLIQSMPGGGKTHLARQYVFQHRYDYQGGIFWIRAKSLEELDYGYWDIAKTVGLSDMAPLNPNGSVDTHEMVKAVQAWLSSQTDWLLILDGVHFDLPDLQHYIPFAKNTSIIYTSTERTPGEDYQFDNPQVIALDSLTKQEAQELLFEEMGKKKPYTQDDLRRAEELVELMDRLPLMIHVAALNLKATREPLAKYLRSFRSRPKVGNLPAYRAVREQLEHRGASAALNLMALLSFFGTHIPVEMIVLGAKALDKRTPVKSVDAETRRSSLNNTFKILIAFALVERNENNEASSASSRSTRSVDMGQDSLDILRVHGIVQAFFIDVLADDRQAHFWLERAICLFCKAFDVSDHRVDEDPLTGVPEDFRRLLIHGERLLAHISRFERRYPELAECRGCIELRLGTINKRIDQLTKRITEASSQGSGAVIISVFERTNSLSEGDSETPPSNSSIVEPYMLYDESSPIESPAIYSPLDHHNPYHWHVTFPHNTSQDDVDYSRTVTPQAAPTEVFESMSMPDDDEITRRVFGPNHRTIKKHASRRYRDRAGSWRAASQILSDPRVSISRETARGIINPTTLQQVLSRPRSSTDSMSSEATKAQLTLDKINKGSPSLQPRSVDSNIDAMSDSILTIRPRLVAGRPSYADPKAEATIDDYPISTTFSSPAPSPDSAALTILKRRENDHSVSLEGLTPIKVSSPLSATPLTTTSLPSPPSPSPPVTQQPSFPEVNKTENILKPPSIPSRSLSNSPLGRVSKPPSRPTSVVLSRSAQSSPAHPSGPFSPPPIPIEINTSSSLRSPPSPGAHQWDSHARLSQQYIAEDNEYPSLAHSLPSIRPHTNLPYPHTVHGPPDDLLASEPPAPWVASTSPNLHPQGYSSQPMSRDQSHQSGHSYGSNNSLSAHNASSIGQLSSSPGSQIMQRPRSRRPSVVETEPSPRIPALDLEPINTSYSLYMDSSRGRRRATSGHASRAEGARLLSRFRPKRRVSDDIGDGRRHRSANGRLGHFTLTRGSRVAVEEANGAEPMARSGSGGIRLADGRVVEFGSGAPPTSESVVMPGSEHVGEANGRPVSSVSPPTRHSRFSPQRLSRRGRTGSGSGSGSGSVRRKRDSQVSPDVGLGIQQPPRRSS
ncbi:uncharacterized protein GGS22DRAFT_158690 [Annulohypoxylon maeteangense]|uniref:uncharacterized protein n=1 Tax=Annulohypoxylon maeteangense TaxID=1927788 RepID=UPI002007B87B|nr:uncharacterized protein GGS22DRAFT_158690 [Annulohypoxylon maeteangense]KAI0886796.1 hypothetical protein GGS22DRAFT_158690 [Annulohypoxylon maeteangense]